MKIIKAIYRLVEQNDAIIERLDFIIDLQRMSIDKARADVHHNESPPYPRFKTK